jgi:hypothetical protein
MTSNKQIDYVKLKIYHYPIEITNHYVDYYGEHYHVHGFYFEPRVFKAGTLSVAGVTEEGLRKVIPFVYEKLANVSINAEVKVQASFVTETPLKVIGEDIVVKVNSEFKFRKFVTNFAELKELYNKLYSAIKMLYNAEPKITIIFDPPLVIPVPKEEVRKLYEILMQTDSQLNCETARKLFDKEFANLVSQHNREVRQKRQQKK